MRNFYRILLFSIACVTSTLLHGQNTSLSRGKIIYQKNKERRKPDSGSVFLKASADQEQNKKFRQQGSSDSEPLSLFQNAIQLSDFVPPYRNCFTVESEKILSDKNPLRLSAESFERKLYSKMSASRMTLDAEMVYKIPTIIHVVHHGEPVGIGSNITQEQIMSQFDVLNEDFRRLGGGFNDHPSGADINIEFVPVLVDPQGKILEEPGVDRIFGYSAYYDYDRTEYELKPNTQWDPDRYFNIWVVKFGGSFSGYLGYAQFPSLSGLEGLPDDNSGSTDGVVIGYQYFGRTGNVVAPFDKGRTTTHEVGHWLGLRHIWGDGDCSVDDYCADTPNADGPNRSCDFRDSCPEEGADMVENYMDYSTDACMNIFTNDQKFRIRTVMEVSPRRNILVSCQQAPVADVGNNLSDKPRAWFQYTAAVDELVKISSIGLTEGDTKLSLYRECHTLPMNVSDNAFNTIQSELTVALHAGETIKILWENETMVEPYVWTLSTGPQELASACELATNAIEGENILPVTTLNTYWYQFMPTQDQQKIHINSSGKQFNVYKGDCDQLNLIKSGSEAMTIYDVDANEKIFIAFDVEGGDFSWSLDAENMQAGESCGSSVTATVGTNVIPYPSPFEYWYTYTIPFNGKLRVTANLNQGSTEVKLFKSCDGLAIAEASGTNIDLSVGLNAGQTVKIFWNGELSIESFGWQLEASVYENGEICSAAKVAHVGINHTDAAPQWFTYTTTKLTNLKISSIGLTDFNTHLIIKRNCDGPIIDDNDDVPGYAQSELVLYGLPAGEQIFILWSEKWSYEGFDWSIEEVDPLPGDNCSTAKQAVIGLNTVEYRPDHSHFGNIFWAKFTVPGNGKTIKAFASRAVDMAIYQNNNCESFSWVDENQGLAQASNLPAGTELVIIWDVASYNSDFTWTLTVEDVAPGDLCDNPIRAVKGTNISESTPAWYDYVMSEAGSLKLTYTGTGGNIIPRVAVLDGCGEDADIIFANEHTAFISGLPQGEHVYIYWTVGYPFSTVKWLLEEIPVKQGDLCSNPLPATYGLNHAEYATQWFSYTAETTGNVKISSRAFTFNDTQLYVYDACDGNLLAESQDIFSTEDFILYFQSEAVIENVQAGQTLLIKWGGSYSYEPFTWEITTDGPRQGDSCEDPLIAVEGVNNGMKPAPAWFSFTMPQTAALSLSSLGFTDLNTNVEVYDACNGNLIASNDDFGGDQTTFLYINELQEGQTVLIRWADGVPSEQYTFDWRLDVGQPDPGLVCIFPVAAHEGTNTTPAYLSNYFWYSFTMPEENKKLVITRLDASPAQYKAVGVTSDCDRAIVYGIGEDQLTLTGLHAGEQVLIFWSESLSGERPTADWQLQVLDLEAGDVCESAIEASRGEYHSDGETKWYKYTMPIPGNLYLTSLGLNSPDLNTYVEVYDACDGNLIGSNDNPDDWSYLNANLVLENLELGQSVWIKWSTAPPFQVSYNWKLEIENPNNHSPAFGNSVFQLSSKTQNGQIVGTLSATDEDNDALTYSITAGNSDGAFALHSTNGELTVADANKIGARELTVSVSDGFLVAQATVTLDIITSALGDEAGEIRAYPNPATDKVYVTLPPQLEVYESCLVDVSGNVLRIISHSEREFSLADFKPGIYFLKLKTRQGQITLKVAVVK
jgi:hypothetical protein